VFVCLPSISFVCACKARGTFLITVLNISFFVPFKTAYRVVFARNTYTHLLVWYATAPTLATIAFMAGVATAVAALVSLSSPPPPPSTSPSSSPSLSSASRGRFYALVAGQLLVHSLWTAFSTSAGERRQRSLASLFLAFCTSVRAQYLTPLSSFMSTLETLQHQSQSTPATLRPLTRRSLPHSRLFHTSPPPVS
jgi:hypothetical protein